ncbi:hypothetical protein SAMN02745206_03257 [Desulfacinum infernum DSM 9756]|uniref:Uncharacterized protein n=1 Tax=Desulfacinum infernum DSM 9756 TaxID=1121391 RepID=A0A1M5H1E3_9BACT|nr:hypothetical protein [Desulfacinum infernum]SHG09743.1 hypothetical protein SAMN02745206_03257 [Desulfacinum infernum DSM 9756]
MLEILDPRFRGDDEWALNGANLPLSDRLLATCPIMGGFYAGMETMDPRSPFKPGTSFAGMTDGGRATEFAHSRVGFYELV